jgi:hypothetical protein
MAHWRLLCHPFPRPSLLGAQGTHKPMALRALSTSRNHMVSLCLQNRPGSAIRQGQRGGHNEGRRGSRKLTATSVSDNGRCKFSAPPKTKERTGKDDEELWDGSENDTRITNPREENLFSTWHNGTGYFAWAAPGRPVFNYLLLSKVCDPQNRTAN